MREKKEKEEKLKEIDFRTLLKYPPSQDNLPEHKLLWYKLCPYDDGFLPLLKMTRPYTILYLRRNDKRVEFYVRTRSHPNVLTSAGYVINKIPMEDALHDKVHVAVASLVNKDDHYFVDFMIDNFIDVLEGLPSNSAIAITVSNLPKKFKEKLTKRVEDLLLKSKELKLSPGYYDLVKATLRSIYDNIAHKTLDDLILNIRANKIYLINLFILSKNEKDLESIAGSIDDNDRNIELEWKTFSTTWDKALSKLSELELPVKTLSPTTSLEQLRNFAILPPCNLTPCIPKGTIPVELITKSHGFKIGTGTDSHEFKVTPSDFHAHCLITGINYDLLVNIIKVIKNTGKVLVIDGRGITNILRERGIEHAFYNILDYRINPFRIPITLKEDVAIDILAYTLDKIFALPIEVQDIKEFLEFFYYEVGEISPSLIESTISDLISYDIIYADRDHDYYFNKLYNAMRVYLKTYILRLLALGHSFGEYDFPIEETLNANVTVVGSTYDLNDNYAMLFYSALIQYLVELQANTFKDIFLILIPPKSQAVPVHHYDLLSRILDLNLPAHVILVTDQHIENHEVISRVGIRFNVSGSNAYMWIENRGPAFITIDRAEIKEAKVILDNKKKLAKRCSSVETALGSVFKYINPDDALKSLVLYEIYRNRRISSSKIMNVLTEAIPEVNTDNLRKILKNLIESDFIKVNSDKTVEYNEGFEKWFSSAVPSMKGREVVREIVDYYFSRGYCVVPVKQKPGTQRPDSIAIQFNPKNKRLRYNKAIAIEVEAHLDKGQNTIEQAKKNMTKNTDFRETHVWTFPEYREIITNVYSELSDDEKKRVKIFFFGEEVFTLRDETKVERARTDKKRHQREVKKVIVPREMQTLDRFSKPEKEEAVEEDKSDKEKKERLEERAEEKVDIVGGKEKIDVEQHDKTDVEKELDKEEVEVEENIVRVAWNGRVYELERTEDSEIMKEIIEDIVRGKRNDLSVVVRGNFLKIVDESGITIVKAKILRVV